MREEERDRGAAQVPPPRTSTAGEAEALDVARLKELLAAATPGPVAWMGNGPHNIYLATTHSGRVFVMGFKRMGIQGAQPVFPKDGRLVPASDMLKFDVGDPSVTGMTAAKADSSVYRYDVRDIENAEAQLLVAARNALPALLAEIERLRRPSGWQQIERKAALEEAAERADAYGIGLIPDFRWVADDIAAAIRDLISREPPEQAAGDAGLPDRAIARDTPIPSPTSAAREMREALEPFAKAANATHGHYEMLDSDVVWEFGFFTKITAGDLRRIEAALTSAKAAGI